jgi:hypothetical protein
MSIATAMSVCLSVRQKLQTQLLVHTNARQLMRNVADFESIPYLVAGACAILALGKISALVQTVRRTLIISVQRHN